MRLRFLCRLGLTFLFLFLSWFNFYLIFLKKPVILVLLEEIGCKIIFFSLFWYFFVRLKFLHFFMMRLVDISVKIAQKLSWIHYFITHYKFANPFYLILCIFYCQVYKPFIKMLDRKYS